MILTLNKHELPAMKAFVERYGLNFRYDGTLWPTVDGGMQPLQYAISMEEMIQIDLDYPERSSEWKRLSAQFEGIAVRNEYVYSCGAGLCTFHIDNTGRMSACMMARQPSFDLFSTSFSDAWQQIGELRNKKRQRHTECETCLVGALCLQCPGWS
jgi:radical SAM protein with 4Fe4S-binding SPASM domain